MNSRWVFFEIAINLFQSGLFLWFIKSRSHISRPSKVADFLAVTACTAFYSLYLFVPVPISDSFDMLIFWVYLLYVSDDRWYISALWVVLKEVISLATIGISMEAFNLITSVSYQSLLLPSPLRIVYVLITNMLLFIVFFTASKMKKTYSPIDIHALYFFLVSNILIFLTIDVVFALHIQQQNKDWRFFAAYAFLFANSILSVFLFHLMTDVVRKEHQAQLALNHAQLTKEHQRVIKDMYTDMLARQHDFKHQLQTIEQLVEQGHSVQAKAYAIEYKQRIAESEVFVTGSIAVDALLTTKELTCKENGIDFELIPYPLNNLPICEVDFCAIVGNLLDNAIEGTIRIADECCQRWIRLSFQRVWDTFIICCENNMSPKMIKRHAGGFLTSKEGDPHLHGFGIRNIELISQAADGFCDFETDDGVFIAKVTLPYPMGEESSFCSKL